MSAPVYVGKHAATQNEYYVGRHATVGCSVCQDTGALHTSWPQVAGLISKPCPNGCIARQDFRLVVPLWRFQAPVAASPSKAATVKAGGVATLTGGDTTQPETQR